jgi:hypothetical protein
MALVVKDRVKETTTTTGTGTITLAGAVTGFQSFSVIGDANTTYYAIVGGTQWEVGIGTYTSSGTTLSRDTVLESSTGGTKVDFAAGSKDVFVTYPAEESVDQDTAQTLTNKTFDGGTVVTANSSATALRITQTGSGNALVVEDSANPDSTPLVIDQNGNMAIGFVPGVFGQPFSIATSSNTGATFLDYVNNSGAFSLNFAKSRTGTTPYNTPTIVQSGDVLGSINFNGADGGAAYVTGARIRSEVDGTPGTNDMPGRLVFSTTADGASSPTERMRITSAGDVGIGTTSTGGYRVAVVGSTASSVPLYLNSDATNAYVYSPNPLYLGSTGANQLAFVTNNTERMRITSAGNVGIGITSPSVALDVLGTIEAQVALTQDAVAIAGRAGGTSSYVATITPTTLTASRTITLPNATGTVALLGTAQTFTAVQTLTDPAIIGAITEDIFTITDGAAFEVDPGNGSIQLITLGANRTPKATNFAAGESVTLMVNDGSAYAITWTDSTWGTGGVVWVNGAAPTLATTGYTVLEFWKVSTQVYGAIVGSVA